MKEIIAFSSFPDFSGNCKALFEDMNTSDCKFDLVWFCKDEEVTQRLNQMGIKAYWDKAEDFMEVFNKAKIVINTHDYYMNIKNENQIFINLWHGLGPKKSGTLADKETDWICNFSTKNDFLIATSEFGRFIFSSTFNMPIEYVKQFPQARYKWLFENKGRDNLEKLLQKDLKQFKKIIMYAPTFRKGIGRIDAQLNEDNFLNLENYNEKALIDYLEKNKILLILKLHPVEESSLKEIQSNNIIKLSDNVMLDNFITINEVLDGVDLLISDYSSIYVDYVNLGRPIIFFDTDKEEFEKTRGIIFDSLDFWWKAGPKVHSIDNFIEEVDKLFDDENYYKEERKQFNKLVNGKAHNTNKELIDFIFNIDKEQNKKENKKHNISLLEKNNVLLKEKIKELQNMINDKENIINQLENQKILKQKEIENLNNELKYVRTEYDKVSKELESIKYSRSYKMIAKLRKIINKK